MVKRLIYPIEYFADITFMRIDELDKNEQVLVGIFSGIDVRTGEEVIESTFQKESLDMDEAQFFKDNDVLYLDYAYMLNFCVGRIPNRRESFDFVKRKYEELKSCGLDDEEINEKMMKRFNTCKVKTKRLYK